jgi:hypothetical protein
MTFEPLRNHLNRLAKIKPFGVFVEPAGSEAYVSQKLGAKRTQGATDPLRAEEAVSPTGAAAVSVAPGIVRHIGERLGR